MPRMRQPRRRLGRLAAVTALLLAIPAVSQASGIVFLPGATRAAIVPGSPCLEILTWQFPEGLLVADRTSPGQSTRFGAPFAPRFERSEWFVIENREVRVPSEITPAALGEFGHLHWSGETASLIEVPAARLDRFFAQGHRLQRIALTAPPVASALSGDAAADTARFTLEPTPPAPAHADKVDDALKLSFVNTLSADAFFLTIREISGTTSFWFDGAARTVTTRYYNTASKNLVGAYLAAKLVDYGYTVELDTFLVGGVTCRNIVATKTGQTHPDEIVVVGGHYDSISQQAATLAPGAEDNGSGTSLVMEIARASGSREFDRTVQFVLFDSEEQGLNGSEHFVAEAVAAGRDVVAAITADMITWYTTHYGLRIEGETAWEWLMTAMASNVDGFTDISYRKDYYSFGSDHVSFQQAGIAAFLAIDWDWASYPYYHRATDTWSAIQATAGLGHQIARAAAATLADVAGLRPEASAILTPPLARVHLAARPNPFNPRVSVIFALESQVAGEVAVFDLAGRKVAVLASGLLSAGEHETTWDGTDRRGHALPSGIYLCRLTSTAGSARLKLVLAR